MRLVEQKVTLGAPIEDVYRHLTTVDGLLRWMAVDAVVEAVPGGRLEWTHENGATMLGRFIELEPPFRLVFSYGWKDDLMGVPPDSTTVEVTLEETDGKTTLVLNHLSLPPDVVDDHEHGWKYFLSRLHTALEP